MIEVQVRPEGDLPGVEDMVIRAGEAALRQAEQDPERLALTVVVAGDEELADLNQRYRGIEGPTDVLSFEAGEEDVTGELAGYLGDVIISADRARAQAEEAGHSVQEELALLVAHGVLHL
ncbi:MAG: rRNA maturation RNase YbeY, partial [Anaerolineae bacterium]